MDESKSTRIGVNKFRNKLLGFSSKNKLLNFNVNKPPKDYLALVNGDVSSIWNLVIGKSTDAAGSVSITPLPLTPIPKISKLNHSKFGLAWSAISAHLNDAKQNLDLQESASVLNIKISHRLPQGIPSKSVDNFKLRVGMFNDDLVSKCLTINKKVESEQLEKGIRCPLYLIFGFLKYTESDSSITPRYAPLVMVPVSIIVNEFNTSDLGFSDISISLIEDELPRVNLTLKELLSKDYSIELPPLDSLRLPHISEYFKETSRVISHKAGWEIENMVGISMLSFNKEVLWNDLNPEFWQRDNGNILLDNPIINAMIFGNKISEDLTIDRPYDGGEIYDSDIYQSNVIDQVIGKGKSLVINGPPGSGKSQTITNLISSAISNNLSVLFIAEKQAALEVVKLKLDKAGLGSFVLDLHDPSSSKADVIESIHRRHGQSFLPDPNYSNKLKARKNREAILVEYADLINIPLDAYAGLSPHDIFWNVSKLKAHCSKISPEIDPVFYSGISAQEFQSQVDLTSKIVSKFKDISKEGLQAWRSVIPESLDVYQIKLLSESFKDIYKAASYIEKESHNIFQSPTFIKADAVIQVQESLSKYFAIFTKFDRDSLESCVKEGWVLNPSPVIHFLAKVREANSIIEDIQGAFVQEISSDSRILDSYFIESMDSVFKLPAKDTTIFDTNLKISEFNKAISVCNQFESEISSLFFKLFGKEFLHTTSQLTALFHYISVLKYAPNHATQHLTPNLLARDISDVLNQLSDKFSAIDKLAKNLAELAIMDNIPSLEEARYLISDLKDGISWYHIGGSKRKSLKHIRAFMHKGKQASDSEMNSALQLIISLYSAMAKFQQDPNLVRVCKGQPIESIDQINELIEVSQWIARVRQLFPEGSDIELCNKVLQDFNSQQSFIVNINLDEFRTIISSLASAYSEIDSIKDFFGIKEDRLLPNVTDSVRQIETVLATYSDLFNDRIKIRDCLKLLKIRNTAISKLKDIDAEDTRPFNSTGWFKNRHSDASLRSAVAEFGLAITWLKTSDLFNSRLLSDFTILKLEETVKYLKEVRDLCDVVNSNVSIVKSKLSSYPSSISSWDDTSINSIASDSSVFFENITALSPWAEYLSVSKSLRDKSSGVESILNKMEQSLVSPNSVVSCYKFLVFSSMANKLVSDDPVLRQFSGSEHSKIRAEFASLDQEVVAMTGAHVSYRVAGFYSEVTGTKGTSAIDPNATEMNLLNKLFGKPRPRSSLRSIILRAYKSIRGLKPCFMMSPASMATFLDPKLPPFDLVIMDEASQIRAEDAIGAIARGHQVVIVGDPKQMPPSSYFQRSDDDEEDFIYDEEEIISVDKVESVLEMAVKALPQELLAYHYRSKHPSLIKFSNEFFYGNKLHIYPSNVNPFNVNPKNNKNKQDGVKFHYVEDGYFNNDPSAKGTNSEEIEKVISLILELIKNNPNLSMGIVALNMAQATAIEEELSIKQDHLKFLDLYIKQMKQKGEPLFIKSLEEVQGHERDIIVISTTYGKDENTDRVPNRFGPINNEGGERRLNVLFTRAKYQMHVVSSLTPLDIDVNSGTKVNQGKLAFRDFLQFAKDGGRWQKSRDREPDSPFEVSVISALTSHGFEVVPQLGVAGYFIDIAVIDPNNPSRFLAAVECDGATYHSGRRARDRDRLRQSILEHNGWDGKIYRIWSTDWFKDNVAAEKRLISFLNELAPNRPIQSGNQSRVDADSGKATLKDTSKGSLNTSGLFKNSKK